MSRSCATSLFIHYNGNGDSALIFIRSLNAWYFIGPKQTARTLRVYTLEFEGVISLRCSMRSYSYPHHALPKYITLICETVS